MANKNKLKPKGHLYISSPTLEGLVLLCENAKEAAHISGIEYSNFLKACKMEKDNLAHIESVLQAWGRKFWLSIFLWEP